MEILRTLIQWTLRIIETGSYPGLVFVTVLENVFPPIPSEAILPFAGFLSVTGKFNIWLVILSGTLGSLLGALVLYAFGYYGGEKIVRVFINKYGKYMLLQEEDLDGAIAFFKKNGRPAVLTARVIPIFRSIVSIPAGLAKMPLPEFIFFTILGTGFWCTILAFLGRILGENWTLVSVWLGRYEKIILALVVVVLGYIVYKRIKLLKSHK